MERIGNDMRRCRLCPRACGADRSGGQRGICGQTAQIKAARAALHMWEEPCISGKNGSGAVFFSGCGLRCVFCQNHDIAYGDAGKEVSVQRLADIFLELQESGANNINLVTAGHFAPQVIHALEIAKRGGLCLPVIYNTGGYEALHTLRMLEGYVDVYLPDLKYMDVDRSSRYSNASDYFAKASAAIAEMVRQCGRMQFTDERTRTEKLDIKAYQKRSESGESLLMTKGVVVRHLLLPGGLADAKQIVGYLLRQYGDRIFISLLNQYTPLPHAAGFPELMRKITDKEYEELVSYALDHGIENGFIQEGETAEEGFIPEFNGKGIEK